jgi:hypothetical protein
VPTFLDQEVEMIDQGAHSGLESMRTALQADGYEIDVREVGGHVDAQITATADACEDCLAPKAVLLAMLGQALGVPVESIDLRYPGES